MKSQKVRKNGYSYEYKKKIITRLLIVFMAGVVLFEASASVPIIKAEESENKPHKITGSEVEIFFDELLPKQLEEYHIAGATVSVVEDGEVIFENGYGFYNIEKDKKVSPQTTLFRVGSITKLFTWTAVMQLVEAGKIDLDKDINCYLKDFKIPEAFKKPITMRNLMTHTTGFDDRLSNLFSPPDSKVIPLGDYLKDTMPKRNYAPGEMIAYSNYGAALAGYIVEQVSGQDYTDYIQEHIFEPLHMNHTFFEQPVRDAYSVNSSLGFLYKNESYIGRSDAVIQLVPAGAISTTASDMAKFMIAHLQDSQVGDARIMNEATVQEMHSRQFASDDRLPGMCLGFMEWYRNGKRMIWHSGGTMLFKSLCMLIPDENIGLFVSYNVPHSEEARNELRQAFLDRFYPFSEDAPQPLNGYKERAKRYEGVYKEGRMAEYNSDKIIFAFSRNKSVTANKDGTINFLDSRYIEVEPLFFREINGQGKLIFKENNHGEIVGVYQDFEPHESYIKIPWYESIVIQSGILILCLLVFLYAVIGWGIIRRMRKNNLWYKKDEELLKSGRRLIRCLSLLNFIYPILICSGLILKISTGYTFVRVMLEVSFFLPVFTFLLSCLGILYAIVAFKNRIWSLNYRIQYSLILFTGYIYIAWLKFWNLMGFYS